MMDALHTLADGDEGVRSVGPAEYFECFYDWIRHRNDGEMRANGAIETEERRLLTNVREILDQACDATPQFIDIEAFIATGWPERVQPIAQEALTLMTKRGRFDEDEEEGEPSIIISDP